jgi:predicted aminopeptidase
MRQFAQDELRLPVDGLYLTYADLKRPLAVYNVHAAKPFSLEPKTWWYPVVGQLQYRGFFSEKAAHDYAHKLEAEGYEVHMAGVEAYSTLGWFRDPVLNTFLDHSPSDIAEILFHELAHQRLFISDETAWNEAFAVAVAEEGVQRWLRSTGRFAEADTYALESRRNREFVELLTTTRDRLAQLYEQAAGLRLDPAHPGAAYYLVQESKQTILADLTCQYHEFKTRWNDYSGYDGWFTQPINNAHLSAVDSYFRLVPLFQSLLVTKGGDLEEFYRAVQSLSVLPVNERTHKLAEIDNAVRHAAKEVRQNTVKAATDDSSQDAPVSAAAAAHL